MIAIKRVNILLFYEIIFQFILLCRRAHLFIFRIAGAGHAGGEHTLEEKRTIVQAQITHLILGRKPREERRIFIAMCVIRDRNLKSFCCFHVIHFHCL